MVEPDGDLNKNALQTAKSGGHGIGAIDDIDGDKQDSVKELIDDLANEGLEDADFDD